MTIIRPPKPGNDPSMQQWARWVNNELATRDRELGLLRDYVAGQKKNVPRTATDDSTIQASTGTNTEWQNMPPNQGPFLQVNCTTGLLKVTVAARHIGVRTDLTTQQQTDMCMSVSVDNELLYKGNLTAIAAQSYTTTHQVIANAPSTYNPRAVLSRDIYIPLPVGEYTIKAEYLWFNHTPSIQPNWAYRTITAESI